MVVVGGGPAGSTASTLLSDQGWNVALVEKDKHPRFHIGESLLPWNLPIFERLSVLDEVRKIGVVKNGIDFSVPSDESGISFAFRDARAPTPPSAFQVKRSDLDELLLRNAAKHGVHVVEETRVTQLDLDHPDAVIVDTAGPNDTAARWTARFVVDASGRDTLLGRALSLKERHPTHKSAALFSHFTGVRRSEGAGAGNIGIHWFERGWIWTIPLRDDITSVGVVAAPSYFQNQEQTPEEQLRQSIALSPAVAARMRHAEMVLPATATGNFSYICRRMWGERFMLVGDAYAFIDPVFSSGVFLAMDGAASAAGAIDAYLRDPQRGKASLRRHERRTKRAIRNYSWFIERFNEPATKALFMRPNNLLGMRSAILSRLAGDVHSATRFWVSLGLYKIIYNCTRLIRSKAGDVPAKRDFDNRLK
ncbi:MAG TPA: NAD(P)/FAD-dependent oxidoreductase [Alphaproteobacteria bacterium]|nr:NAD(P)/FAD-dependent oxidoreductase [Alphaproteobacteria bacterium]